MLEKLDMREFKKSRRTNGIFSLFVRGKLQRRLMQELNWRGFDFLEVAPDYTSQVCPVCNFLDDRNRDRKEFICICCGYHDDADHVGAINIRARASDKEILKICERNKVHIGPLLNKIFQNNEIKSNIVQSSSIRHLLPPFFSYIAFVYPCANLIWTKKERPGTGLVGVFLENLILKKSLIFLKIRYKINIG